MDLHSMVISLKPYNTFGIDARARVFLIKNTVDIVNYFEKHNGEEYFVLGGGSNVIFSDTVANKNILKIEILGREIIEEINNDVYVKIGAGENWDSVVAWSVAYNLSGIEALSAIPGTTGATPVQNVGAYGREIKDVFVSLSAYDTQENKVVQIKNSECGFTYRSSIFKGVAKGRYIIIDIVLKLSKNAPMIPNYPAVQKYFSDVGNTNPSLLDIRSAITEIRWSKLPRPEEVGNCGSFFENPIVDKNIFLEIKKQYLDIPSFEMDDSKVKIPAGWLIEKSGMKGVSFGTVGTYDKNALVLINQGNANHIDVLEARNIIIEAVKKKFGITLMSEPEIVI